jgi:hypothetical protein
MILCRFDGEVVFARFTAETQTPIVVADKTKLSATACTAVLQLGHEALLRSGGLILPRLPGTAIVAELVAASPA